MKTIKEFAAKSNVPETLIRSVIMRVGGWNEFKGIVEDVRDYGASGGFHGFTYYADTLAFFEHNKKLIMALAKEQASEFGCGVYQMIWSFNCLKIAESEVVEAIYDHGEAETDVKNALAWYAFEEVCRAYCDAVEGY